MKNKLKRGILLALAGVLCLAGCQAAAPAQPVTITLMHGWGGSGVDHRAMRRIFEDFDTANPDITLQYDASPDIAVVITKAGNMLAADKMPDIISTNGNASFVEGAEKKQLALDLAPYLAADAAFDENVSDRVKNLWTNPDGTLYTIPDVQEMIGYWYNEDLFRQAGITDTGTAAGNVVLPTTWPEFWAACDALAAMEPQTGAAPMRMQKDQLRILLGARLAAQDSDSRRFMQCKAAACVPAEVEAAFADLEKAVSYYHGEPLSVSDARQMFFDGKSAIYWNGVWANTELTQTTTEQHIRYACFPSSTGDRVVYSSPQSGYVLGNTGSPEQIEACVRFLKYMVSEDVQKRLVVETGQVPSNPKITAAWIAGKVPVLGDAVAVCKSASLEILSLYNVLPDREGARLDACLEQLLAGRASAADFVELLTDS